MPLADDKYTFKKTGFESYALQFAEGFALTLHDVLVHYASLLRLAEAKPDEYGFLLQGYKLRANQAERIADSLGEAILQPAPAAAPAVTKALAA